MSTLEFIERNFSHEIPSLPGFSPLADKTARRATIQRVIDDAVDLHEWNKASVFRNIFERYFGPKKDFKSHPEFVRGVTMMLEACYIRVLSERDEGKRVMLTSFKQLADEFPSIASLHQGPSDDDWELLLGFRNMLKVSLLLIAPYRNRDKLWELASRLEGSGNEYHRGGGQRDEVTWRVTIFEELLEGTGGEKVPRPNQHTIKKRKLEALGHPQHAPPSAEAGFCPSTVSAGIMDVAPSAASVGSGMAGHLPASFYFQAQWMTSAAAPAPMPVATAPLAAAFLLVDDVGGMDMDPVEALSSFDMNESCFDVDMDESRNRSHIALQVTDPGSSSLGVFDFNRVMGEAGLDFGDWTEAEIDAIVQTPPPAFPQAAPAAVPAAAAAAVAV